MQVVDEHKGAATTLDGAQFTGIDGFIESRPAHARESARLGIGKRSVHKEDFAIVGRDYSGDQARVIASIGDIVIWTRFDLKDGPA